MQSTRRQFVIYSVSGVGALCLGAAAQAQAMVSEADPQAAAVGYKADTSKVDNKKFPKHTAAQQCSNCALYQGAATAASAGCAIFPGKKVSGKGWCSAWAKKG
ncbi:MAG: hypothetical protein RLZZ344_1788 [Pseudomonadota bacterium]